MNKENNAKHSSKQVRKKLGVPNLNAEFAGEDPKAPKGTSQKTKQ
ncbi:hypothetical protein V3851_24710 [Paenibacillus sp. M1]|uniref:Small acid-soluble spore protein L (Minor) n=1 Tax=Paenibacillus haidiansis TaxID=1574488 RepID=A0ABU7VZ05_9BACL